MGYKIFSRTDPIMPNKVISKKGLSIFKEEIESIPSTFVLRALSIFDTRRMKLYGEVCYTEFGKKYYISNVPYELTANKFRNNVY